MFVRGSGMRFLISLLFVLPVFAQPGGFTVLSPDAGSWPQILTSVGLYPSAESTASVFVARNGANASPEWQKRVEEGAFLVLEGESALARSFGFIGQSETTRLTALADNRRPQLPLILEKALEIRRTQLPSSAHIFSKDRWSETPVMAGFRQGKGAVLWLAMNPGKQGFERFPYLPQAMKDLGFDPPFRGNRTWAFFDGSYRNRVDLQYFARQWHATGISALQVAAWHFFDNDPEQNAYLQRLIEACHQEGILVYAWLELPHVSEKFWADHPQWREKTAVLQDAQLDWRKLMNLADPECAQAVRAGLQQLMQRFDWDGMNFAELYYESLEGAANPARFTPMNDTIRAAFRQTANGFDPVELWSTRTDAASLRRFLEYRAGLARKLQTEWLNEAESYRKTKPYLDLVLTHVDDRFDTGMRDAIGADTTQVLPLLKAHDFTFLIEDPATIWHLGPKRYPELAAKYPASPQLAIDINIVDRYQDVYPTKQQTGLELFQLVHLASSAFARVALYFENSLARVDLPLLSAAAATYSDVNFTNGKLSLQSPYGVGVRWKGGAKVDGRLWPVGDGQIIWLPAGPHEVEPTTEIAPTRLLAFNGTLQSASCSGNTLVIAYQSSSRALATLNTPPTAVIVDGQKTFPVLAGKTLLLPKGQHRVEIN